MTLNKKTLYFGEFRNNFLGDVFSDFFFFAFLRAILGTIFGAIFQAISRGCLRHCLGRLDRLAKEVVKYLSVLLLVCIICSKSVRIEGATW